MSKLYKCDICGRFDYTDEELKSIVVLKHQDVNGFLAMYNYKKDIIIPDICPFCLDKVMDKLNELKEEVQNENN